jgi:hypothetical protein
MSGTILPGERRGVTNAAVTLHEFSLPSAVVPSKSQSHLEGILVPSHFEGSTEAAAAKLIAPTRGSALTTRANSNKNLVAADSFALSSPSATTLEPAPDLDRFTDFDLRSIDELFCDPLNAL